MEPKQLTYDICRCYLQDLHGVNKELVAKVGGFHRSRNLSELTSCSLHFDPALHSIRDWKFLRQVEAFFKKNALFADMSNCAQAARDSFFQNERECARTNTRILYYLDRSEEFSDFIKPRIGKMRRYIRNVLGDFDVFLDSIPSLVKVTSGATSSASRRDSLPQLKLRMSLYSTEYASPYVRSLYRFFGFRAPRIKTTDSNRIELVPKNWKTSRTIACEPEGNLPFQLAFDTYAKRRLRLKGIDLSDQSANQRAALKSSVDNLLATVDFSAASDTISFETVQLVFPAEWFDYLWRVRTPSYRGAFGSGRYSKFSSMGNGSTFTIETLIFAAACYAVGSKEFLVYGDDVIIERELFEDYRQLTRFLGFTINREKSYVDGPFRESCGVDAFNGVDVTPVYVRTIDSRQSVLSHLVNTLLELTYPGGKLAELLYYLTRDNKLPLVPHQDSTTSGVWIDPDLARRLGILKRRYWAPGTYSLIPKGLREKYADSYVDRFKALVPKSKSRAFVDIRGYYLWFLNKNSQVLFSGPWELSRGIRSDQTSSAAFFSHKYVRKWVCWKPAVATTDHLIWWSDLLSSRKLTKSQLSVRR